MVFVMGGLNTTDRILDKCELYFKSNDSWNPMPPLCIARNNATALKLTDDSVYCFGGVTENGITDTIEMFSFSLNEWSLLSIKLPNPASLTSVFKLTDRKILIVGGLIKEHSEKTTPYKSNQVLIFDTVEPNFFKSPITLVDDCVSLYPVFYEEDKIYIINEIPDLFLPEVLSLSIKNLI